jgi:hypothetical protein
VNAIYLTIQKIRTRVLSIDNFFLFFKKLFQSKERESHLSFISKTIDRNRYRTSQSRWTVNLHTEVKSRTSRRESPRCSEASREKHSFVVDEQERSEKETHSDVFSGQPMNISLGQPLLSFTLDFFMFKSHLNIPSKFKRDRQKTQLISSIRLDSPFSVTGTLCPTIEAH